MRLIANVVVAIVQLQKANVGHDAADNQHHCVMLISGVYKTGDAKSTSTFVVQKVDFYRPIKQLPCM